MSLDFSDEVFCEVETTGKFGSPNITCFGVDDDVLKMGDELKIEDANVNISEHAWGEVYAGVWLPEDSSKQLFVSKYGETIKISPVVTDEEKAKKKLEEIY